MAAASDVILQCGVCKHESVNIEAFYQHKCIEQNSNESGSQYLREPIGPISSLVPSWYHKYINRRTLKSYIAYNEADAEIFRKKIDPTDIPVLTKEKTNAVYDEVIKYLTDKGKEAIEEINNPHLVNLLIDWCPEFEDLVCSNPKPDPDRFSNTFEQSDEELPEVTLDPAPVENSDQSITSVKYVQKQDDGKWPKEAILLLLENYKSNMPRFNDPKIKKKTVWGAISEILKEKGYSQNPGRCERKLLNLKSKYKMVKIHNSQTGNDPKTCAFFDELENIFGKSPAICPVSTCSSMKGIQGSADVGTSSENDKKKSVVSLESENKNKKCTIKKRSLPEFEDEPTASTSTGSSGEKQENTCKQKMKKPKQTTEEKMLMALHELSEKEEKRMDKMVEMHTQQMKATNSFIEVLQGFLSKDSCDNNNNK